ncbi:hypothetical protein ACFSC6_00335 [Rufibacter sediminis]|uniref:Uncharacterized protein n=1 Tax=Rufibacter sediminis TaxID=2762756 RepID=A0ABR6VLU3_9BACT|nr:hypothetical protein [Rufibacter sediminis]MBC3538201.1 hypothetical protein [Rufibacter sediminis]
MLHQLERKLLLLAAFLFPLSLPALSQTVSTAATSNQTTQSYPVRLYREATKTESHLYNGPEYVDYRRASRDGHQYFLQDKSAPGNVRYDGSLYEDVPLLYDIVTHEVIVVSNGYLLQKLITEKVTAFEWQGHRFIRHVAPDSTVRGALPTGFYDVVYEGGTQLLINRSKLKEDKITDQKVIEVYTSNDRFFIKKDSAYYPVQRAASVYNIFSDKKKELKKFARTQKFSFKHRREEAIMALVRQYDLLKNS